MKQQQVNSPEADFQLQYRNDEMVVRAVGSVLALSPLAAGMGTGAKMHQPLAIAVIGGLVIALPLLLIVLPGFLKLLYKK